MLLTRKDIRHESRNQRHGHRWPDTRLLASTVGARSGALREGAGSSNRRVPHRLLGTRLRDRGAHGNHPDVARARLRDEAVADGRSRRPRGSAHGSDAVVRGTARPFHQPGAGRSRVRARRRLSGNPGPFQRVDQRDRAGRRRVDRDALGRPAGSVRSGRGGRRTAFAGASARLRSGSAVRTVSGLLCRGVSRPRLSAPR